MICNTGRNPRLVLLRVEGVTMASLFKQLPIAICLTAGIVAPLAAQGVSRAGLPEAVRSNLASQRAAVPTGAGIGMRGTTCGEFLSYENVTITSVQDARSPFGQLYIVQAAVTVRMSIVSS
jgi:hypothetical protein